MPRSGRDPGKPPRTVSAAAGFGAPSQPQASRRADLAARRLVLLAVLAQMLRSPRFKEWAAVAAIVLAALAGLSQEDEARFLARLAAWDKRQARRLERRAVRQARELRREEKAALA